MPGPYVLQGPFPLSQAKKGSTIGVYLEPLTLLTQATGGESAPAPDVKGNNLLPGQSEDCHVFCRARMHGGNRTTSWEGDVYPGWTYSRPVQYTVQYRGV